MTDITDTTDLPTTGSLPVRPSALPTAPMATSVWSDDDQGPQEAERHDQEHADDALTVAEMEARLRAGDITLDYEAVQEAFEANLFADPGLALGWLDDREVERVARIDAALNEGREARQAAEQAEAERVERIDNALDRWTRTRAVAGLVSIVATVVALVLLVVVR